MGKKLTVRTFATVLCAIMFVVSGTAVYAFDGGEYHDFRDGEVSFYLPDGWDSKEIDAADSKDNTYEQIMKASGKTGDGTLNLAVYYTSTETEADDYVYIDSKEEALEYYNTYGETAIDGLYMEIPEAGGEEADNGWEYSEPEFFDGEWNGFLVMAVNGAFFTEPSLREEFTHTVYLTAQMTDAYDSEVVVHNFLVFYNDENTSLTEQQSELAQEIADEFYDYDYHNVMMGVTSYWGDDYGTDSGEDGDEILTMILGFIATFVPIVIAALGGIVFLKRKLEKKPAGQKTSSFQKPSSFQKAPPLENIASKWKKERAQRKLFSGKEQRMEKRTERRDERKAASRIERRSTMQMRNREAESAEQRYYESLQTLLKTGLLTREEMRDMLERHERSRSRTKNRR